MTLHTDNDLKLKNFGGKKVYILPRILIKKKDLNQSQKYFGFKKVFLGSPFFGGFP